MDNKEQNTADASKKMTMMQKKMHAYDALMKLSELDEHDICDDECINADIAARTVLKYGSYADRVEAMKHYTTYTIMQCLQDCNDLAS